ncbi:MAG: FAD-dependent oxidoreductase [Proteobacteria bacterium]|nr:FAD-dependent oxidoreductase [Pseudomonadota bacterium]
MTQPMHFTVLGAGTVGVCCALYLQRDGHHVTLVDRGEPASGCSYGNGGIIQIGACVPIATQGVLRQVPKMLLDPEGPLIIRWQYLPRLAPYLMRFIAAARPSRVEAIAKTLASVLGQAIPAYRTLIAAAGAQDLIRETGEMYIYHSDAAFAAARPAHDLRRRNGVRILDVPVEELRQLEPALAPTIKHAVWFPDCIRTTNPALLTRALAEKFVRDGGQIRQETVTDLAVAPDGTLSLATDRGTRAIDRLVVATGAYSKRWTEKLGSFVPLDTERGYHLMLPNPGVELNRPVIVGDHRVGISSMVGGLRIAGTAELARLDAPPNYRRAHRLLAIVKRALPDLNIADPQPWMGHRPSTPDSLPVICQAPRAPKAFLAFGHGHLGLTMGAVTGRLIADLAAGRDAPIDLKPLHVDRFRANRF